ncbi:ketohexokinase [Pyrenophora tritici-repentis Pt-1C-BFP]|uniref:Ketohexokinase n=1 Tax=Pyrenophora tritici-repentis (strain Pt-1C-BFP) TaxID=426418 RepID=B2WC01_PYRTR|nr:ketohexokinase [Pyrenophora tritici-repentis Pt-1C-BFP]EDU50083.1 ketohexokinase [Pyrenophora tritici-repentis Pt-1C-BFP]
MSNFAPSTIEFRALQTKTATMARNPIICVGAVYIDTILTVPHFPIEDEKLRARGLSRRRGGNTANSLEVLSQLQNQDPTITTKTSGAAALHLLAVLPDEHSASAKFICESIPGVNTAGVSLFRHGYEEAASSYIIQSQETRSRTIVSINQLPEMKFEEFKQRIEAFALPLSAEEKVWVHFEGRIPEVTYPCAEFLRDALTRFRISVECEKPERKDIAKVARFADVVFYSKLWAEKNGFGDAKTFLEAQREGTKEGAILCCTWGSGGATALQKGAQETWANVKAWHVSGEEQAQVVDTIGAGDTFIAGILFSVNNHDEWDLQKKLEFANELAGRKVLQEGFSDLGRKMWVAR